MYVYIIKQSDNKLVKIGRTQDIERRLRDLQSGNPYLLSVVYKFKCKSLAESVWLEESMHKYLKNYHAKLGGGTEWFKIGAVGQLVRLGMSNHFNQKKGGKRLRGDYIVVIRSMELYYFLEEGERNYYSTMEGHKALEKKNKIEKQEVIAKKQKAKKKVRDSIYRNNQNRKDILDIYDDQRDASLDPDRNWFKYN